MNLSRSIWEIQQNIISKPTFINLPIFHFNSLRLKKFNCGQKYAELKKTQWFSLKDLEKMQLKKLKRIIYHAYKTVPFYRKMFRKNEIRPEYIKSIRDLNKLPVITKSDLKRNFGINILSSGHYSKKYFYFTSGSTGAPFTIFSDFESGSWKNATRLRILEWAGLNPVKCKAMYFSWRFDYPLKSISFPYEMSFFDLFKGILYLSELKFENNFILKYYKIIEKFQPDVIGSVYNLCSLLSKYFQKLSLEPLKIKAAILTGENVGNTKIIEKLFQAEIFNHYGTSEFGTIASECKEHEGLHVSMENFIVETIDNSELENKAGEIIITDLNNFLMPFIRYNIRDLGKINREECACGRTLIKLDKIYGRKLDVIMKPGGGIVFPSYLIFFLSSFNEIEKYQIIQKNIDRVVLKIVTNVEKNENLEKKIKPELEKILGKEMEIVIKYVKNIKSAEMKRGKFRFIKSLIKNENNYIRR